MPNGHRIKPLPHTHCTECPVRKLAWFEPGEDDALARREALRTTQYTVAAKQPVYQEGDAPREVYTLQSGWVIQYKMLENAHRQVLHVALPGDLLAFRPDLDQPLDHAAVAATDITLCVFNEQSIHQLLSEFPELTHRLFQIQSAQAEQCRRRLSYVGQAPARQRIALFLLDLIERLSVRGVDISQSISFPLNHEDIADAVGITPVHLSRLSSEMRSLGIVDCRYNKLTVRDIGRLQSLAHAGM